MERVTDMTPSESCRVGAWLPVIARAVMKTAGVKDFNVVQNNGICPMEKGAVAVVVIRWLIQR